MALLALVAGQDIEPGDGSGQRRISHGPPLAGSFPPPIPSPGMFTRPSTRIGMAGRPTVAVEPETGLITGIDLTAGNVGDAEAAPDLIESEPGGTVVLGDSAHGTGEFRAHLQERNIQAVIKPPPLRAAIDGGFT